MRAGERKPACSSRAWGRGKHLGPGIGEVGGARLGRLADLFAPGMGYQ